MSIRLSDSTDYELAEPAFLANVHYVVAIIMFADAVLTMIAMGHSMANLILACSHLGQC